MTDQTVVIIGILRGPRDEAIGRHDRRRELLPGFRLEISGRDPWWARPLVGDRRLVREPR